MATETAVTNAAASGAATHPVSIGATKAFLLAHPVGVALVGGVLVGAGTYWVMKKFMGKKEEPAAA
jgi:F0F1-type ATP synthase assembly protein I